MKRPERQWPLPKDRQSPQTFLMGRAVSVSQSLPGLRSCQSLPHGCCLMSGFAAVVPTRPANSVLGGFATSSAPAFPSSCAAAAAAAAAVRGRGDVDSCDTAVPWAYHLRKFILYYNCTIGGIVAIILWVNLYQCTYIYGISAIWDIDTDFYSPLRGNIGPTSATGSASPSLSSTHYGREP